MDTCRFFIVLVCGNAVGSSVGSLVVSEAWPSRGATSTVGHATKCHLWFPLDVFVVGFVSSFFAVKFYQVMGFRSCDLTPCICFFKPFNFTLYVNIQKWLPYKVEETQLANFSFCPLSSQCFPSGRTPLWSGLVTGTWCLALSRSCVHTLNWMKGYVDLGTCLGPGTPGSPPVPTALRWAQVPSDPTLLGFLFWNWRKWEIMGYIFRYLYLLPHLPKSNLGLNFFFLFYNAIHTALGNGSCVTKMSSFFLI